MTAVFGLLVGLVVAAAWRYADRRHFHTLAFLGDDSSRRFNDAMLTGIVGAAAGATAVGQIRLALFAAIGAIALIVTLRVMTSD